MFLYPNNLKAKPTLWLWHLKDIVIITITILFSVLIYSQFKITIFLILSGVYALLSLRFDDLSILDFLTYSIRFFITEPQTYTWKRKEH